MKVAIISTVGVPAKYGGYETLVENLITYKQNSNLQYQIYCSAYAYENKLNTYKGAILKYISFKANGPQGVLYDSISLFHAYLTCDIILSLGTVGCFWLPILKLFSRKKVIVNLDGLDDKREKWNKLARFVIGSARNIASRYANIVVADNQVIQEYIYNKYKRGSVLIEYGGDNAFPYYKENELGLYNLRKDTYAFKVARIEPENKIDIILEAFSRIPHQLLVLVGNWNKSSYGKEIREKYKSFSNICMLDPIYDEYKINLLRSNCSFYIHGHSAGGTNPSLVEAMNLGLSIIAYDVPYNRSTMENKGLYFADSDELVNIINGLDKEGLESMAIHMKEIAKRRYVWKVIVEKYENLFK